MRPDLENASHSEIKKETLAVKRERIVDAAAQMFYDRGYERSTLEAVAGQLGVTKPFIYAFFNSKAELLSDICTRGIGASLAALDDALALDVTPTVTLRQLGRNFLRAVVTNQRHIGILTREEKNLLPADFERLSALRREFDSKLVGLLQAGQATGEFTISDAKIAALSIGGLVSWAYVWYRPDGRLPLDELADRVSDLIASMAGVGTRTDDAELTP